MSFLSVCNLALSLLDILEEIHNAGFVYNDMKLDNIMVGQDDQIEDYDENKNCFQNAKIYLIDFGFTRTYIDNDGKHLRSR